MPRGCASLEKTFSTEYSDQKEDKRLARQKHGKYATRHGPGLAAKLQTNPRHGEAAPAPGGLDNDDLRRQKELQPLMSLRKTMRDRLLGKENPDIETALFKAKRMANKNARLGKDHEKGVRKKTQRPGQGKFGDVENPNSRGFVTSTYTVEHAPACSGGKARESAMAMHEQRAFAFEAAGAESRASLQLDTVKSQVEFRSAPGAVSAAALRCAGELPCAPAANVSVAALRLRATPVEQRPTTLSSLGNWLARQRCCKLRYNVLLPPGKLATAMLALLEDHPQLHSAIEFLTLADLLDENIPSPDAWAKRAKDVSVRLLNIKTQFLEWPIAIRWKWMVDNSWSAVAIKPGELAAELLSRGLVGPLGTNGKLSYNDELLDAEVQPKDGVWTSEDFKPIMSACVLDETSFKLGSEAGAELRTLALWTRGLEAACKDWKAAALHALAAECDGAAPAFAIVSAELEPPSWPTSVRLVTAIGGGTATSGFCARVRQSAVEDIESNMPLVLELADVDVRSSLLANGGREFRRYERIFGCVITVSPQMVASRGAGDITVVFPKLRAAQAAPTHLSAYREVLLAAFAATPAFRCPGVVPSSLFLALEGSNTLSKASEVIGTHYELSSTPSCLGGYDLLGWPGPASFGLGFGVAGSMARYKAAAKTAEGLGLGPVKDWIERNTAEAEIRDALADLNLSAHAGEVAEATLLKGGKVRVGRW